MRNVWAVYRKEMMQYFRSPIAYFVVSVFLIGTGYFFSFNIFFTGIATMTETLQSMGLLLLLTVPMLTMRLFSSEYENGTMELLQTLPLHPWHLVLGKYLGAVTILLLIALGSMIDLVPLYLYAEPETTTIISGYIGFILLGMACLAIGQFCSSMTDNQIVAALVTVSILLALWCVGKLEPFQTSYLLRSIFAYLSFSAHYAQFILGLLRSEAIAFYLIIVAIALTLNAGYLEWRR